MCLCVCVCACRCILGCTEMRVCVWWAHVCIFVSMCECVFVLVCLCVRVSLYLVFVWSLSINSVRFTRSIHRFHFFCSCLHCPRLNRPSRTLCISLWHRTWDVSDPLLIHELQFFGIQEAIHPGTIYVAYGYDGSVTQYPDTGLKQNMMLNLSHARPKA